MRSPLLMAIVVATGLVSTQAMADGLLSAVLPFSRAVQVGSTATAFGTILNDSAGTAVNCRVGKPSGFSGAFTYQRTNPATNAAEGPQNTPVSIAPGAAQTFVFGMTPNTVTPGSEGLDDSLFAPIFTCDNVGPAPSNPGVNGFNLASTAGPTPDIIVVAATIDNDGVLKLPGATGQSFFTAAAINIGASATVLVTADNGEGVGTTEIPVDGYVCETQSDGTVIECATGDDLDEGFMFRSFATNQIRYFTFVVTGQGFIPYDPANRRLFIGFLADGGDGELVGATSIAVRTE